MNRSKPFGFTLIETIIAMSLLSLLMVIVWTMFSIYNKMEAKGVARAEEAGIVRALDRQLRSDLLRIIAIDKERPPALKEIKDPDNPETNRFATNGYLVGSATDLHFVVCGQPALDRADFARVISYEPRSLAGNTSDDSVSAESDTTNSDADESFLVSTEQLDFAAIDEFAMPLGVDRKDRSWRTFWEARALSASADTLVNTNRPVALDSDDVIEVGKGAPDDQNEDVYLAETADLTDEIPEIAKLRFQYFDGKIWNSDWDSTKHGRLPQAIEIGFDIEMVNKDPFHRETDVRTPLNESTRQSRSDPRALREGAAADSDTVSIGDSDETDFVPFSQYRIVVAIPAANVAAGGGRSPGLEQELEQNNLSGDPPSLLDKR